MYVLCIIQNSKNLKNYNDKNVKIGKLKKNLFYFDWK